MAPRALRYTVDSTMLAGIREALAQYTPQRIERDGLPRAAVLIPIYETEGAPHLLFTVRTDLVEHHKGQISFPGGAQDSEDEDLIATALRESEEEIGLLRDHVEVIGQLDDIITISNFLVTPYVGRITEPGPYAFEPSALEVAELLAVPLGHLHEPDTLLREASPWRDRLVPPPAYRYGDHVIWGATARLLQRFLELTRAK
jgi:8-oxo-dGTP pyrophosphatase MutT (NUDIX family)